MRHDPESALSPHRDGCHSAGRRRGRFERLGGSDGHIGRPAKGRVPGGRALHRSFLDAHQAHAHSSSERWPELLRTFLKLTYSPVEPLTLATLPRLLDASGISQDEMDNAKAHWQSQEASLASIIVRRLPTQYEARHLAGHRLRTAHQANPTQRRRFTPLRPSHASSQLQSGRRHAPPA